MLRSAIRNRIPTRSSVVLFGDPSKSFKIIDQEGKSNEHNWGEDAFSLFDLSDFDKKKTIIATPLGITGVSLMGLGGYDLGTNLLELNNTYGSFAIGYLGFYLTHMAVTNNFAGFQSQTRRIRQLENKKYPLVESIAVDPESSEISFSFFSGESRSFHQEDLEIMEDYAPSADFYLSSLSMRSKAHYDMQVRMNSEFNIHEIEKTTSSSYLSSIAGFLAQRMNILKQNFVFVKDSSSGEHFRVPLQIPMITRAQFNKYKDVAIVHDLAKALYQRSKKQSSNSFLEMMQISQKKFQFRYVICFYQQTNTLFWTKILGDPKYKKNYWNWRIHAFFHFIWRSKTYLIFPSGLIYIYFTENKDE